MMARQRATFSKAQRERDKQAKAAAKRDRRQGGRQDALAELSPAGVGREGGAPASVGRDPGAPAGPAGGVDDAGASEVLALLDAVQRRFDAEDIGFDEYEETKAALLRRLPVD